MSKQDNGGPAFPVPLTQGQSYQGHAPCDGMLLRDYFAAKAMQAALAHKHALPPSYDSVVARRAYDMADAMLKAREA